MNTIQVIANGSPGSFARHVQYHPEVAVKLARACEALLERLEDCFPHNEADKRACEAAYSALAIYRELTK